MPVRRYGVPVIQYRTSLEGIGSDDLADFFVGWTSPPTAQEHLQLLKGSSHVVLATDRERVVGFINALSDGILAAYIPLLEVLPPYQGRGIGTQLASRMLKILNSRYMVDLICDRPLEAFYGRFGMKPAFGMAVRNNRWRSAE